MLDVYGKRMKNKQTKENRMGEEIITPLNLHDSLTICQNWEELLRSPFRADCSQLSSTNLWRFISMQTGLFCRQVLTNGKYGPRSFNVDADWQWDILIRNNCSAFHVRFRFWGVVVVETSWNNWNSLDLSRITWKTVIFNFLRFFLWRRWFHFWLQ